MDAKITLSFNREVIQKAKAFSETQNISLSRLVEFLLRRATADDFRELEDFPIAEWVQQVAEGRAEYTKKPKTRNALKREFFSSRK